MARRKPKPTGSPGNPEVLRRFMRSGSFWDESVPEVDPGKGKGKGKSGGATDQPKGKGKGKGAQSGGKGRRGGKGGGLDFWRGARR